MAAWEPSSIAQRLRDVVIYGSRRAMLTLESTFCQNTEGDGVERSERVAPGFDGAGNLIECAVRGLAAEIETLAHADDRRHRISLPPSVEVATGQVAGRCA